MTDTAKALGNTTNKVSTRQRKYALQDTAAKLLPNERVSFCCRHVAPGKAGVSVTYHGDHGGGYSGVMTCGSVWTCPICSARISAVRREELGRAVTNWQGSTLLLTLTLQHNREDSLAQLVDALKTAWKQLKTGRSWQKLRAQFGLAAYATGTEPTYGLAAGWHPHLHIILWSTLPKDELDREELLAQLRNRWLAVLAKNGRYASECYGIDLRAGSEQAAKYAAKFGIEWEVVGMTMGTKLAQNEHYTPWQLLELAGQGDEHAAALFKEYAAVFGGRRQLTWSHGAREILGLDEEKTDEEIAAEDDPGEVVTVLMRDQWGEVCKAGARGILLDVVTNTQGDRAQVWEYLIGLGIQPRPENFSGIG